MPHKGWPTCRSDSLSVLRASFLCKWEIVQCPEVNVNCWQGPSKDGSNFLQFGEVWFTLALESWERAPRSLHVLLWVNTAPQKCYTSWLCECTTTTVIPAGDQSARQGHMCKEDTDLTRTSKAGWDRVVPYMDPTPSEMQWFHLAPHRCVLLLISPFPAAPKVSHVGPKIIYTLSKWKTAFYPIFSVSGRADPIGPLTTFMKTRDASTNISGQGFITDEATKNYCNLSPSKFFELQDTYGLYFVYFSKVD